MRAEVANHAGEAGDVRVGPPCGLLVPALFQGSGRPARGVLHVRERDASQLAVAHHPGRVAHHGVGRVAVRNREDGAIVSGGPHQFRGGH